MKITNNTAGMRRALWAIGLLLSASSLASFAEEMDYEKARWDPIHFKPAIDTATDEQCLACHQEILENSIKGASPAGVKSSDVLAWYQTLETYEGEQDTFHRRHLTTPFAKRVMNLRCNTCHEGNSPREEAPVPPTAKDAGFTLRKMVNPETTCLKCHGQHNYKVMNLPGPWEETREAMGNSCVGCHAAFRTHRHQVNYLNAEEIEKAGQENADACYGCHGGRSWYRITYPYPRHAWPNMTPETPDWAKDRPTESEPRFQLKPAADKKAADKQAVAADKKPAEQPVAADKKPVEKQPAPAAVDKKPADESAAEKPKG